MWVRKCDLDAEVEAEPPTSGGPGDAALEAARRSYEDALA